MINYESVYEPREDSKLLEKYVRQYAKGSVLDIGTGSGIQAITATKSRKVKNVIAADIQKSTIEHCKKNIINIKIKFIVSDLFKNKNLINKKFDTIIFNPPYLPQELKVKDLTLEGGKKGYEVIERFLNEANNYLKTDGVILIVFSSFTKKEKIDEFISNNLLEHITLEKQHIFFEDLYVYKIEKSALLKRLENKKITDIKYLAKGKRGFVYVGKFNARKSKISGTNSVGDKKVAIKIKNPKSEAILRTENEIKFLKLLNKKNIGPKLLFYDKDYLVYEFVNGSFILDYLKNNGKANVKMVFKKIFEQLFIMDKLRINKEEMSHPTKHIIIDKNNKPVLIDFERCHYVLKPGNVTQFCDFLISNNIIKTLKNKKININKNKIINAARKYKKQQNTRKSKIFGVLKIPKNFHDKQNFNNIIKLIN